MHRLAYKHTQWPTLFREWFCSSEANRHEICTRLRHCLKIKVPRVSPERKLGKLHEGIMLIFVPEKIGHYFWWRVYQMSVISQHPLSLITGSSPRNKPGPWFNIKMSSYQYRKSHGGDKTILRPSYLHHGISYTGKTTSLYWIGAQNPMSTSEIIKRLTADAATRDGGKLDGKQPPSVLITTPILTSCTCLALSSQ